MSAAIAYTSVYEKRVGKALRVEERNAMEGSVLNLAIMYLTRPSKGFKMKAGAKFILQLST